MIILFKGAYIETIGIKNLLNSFGIESYMENEFMSNIKPSLLNSGGFNAVCLQVNEKDFAKAKKILDDYKEGILSLDLQ